jgi:hypothetical protein
LCARSLTEVKMPRAMTSRSILASQFSTWLSREIGRSQVEVEFGVSGEELLNPPGLIADRLSAITWISWPRGWLATKSVRKATNSWLVWAI